MKSSKSSLIPISQILNSSFKNLKLEENFKVYPIWKSWESIVGKAIAAKTNPDYVQGTTLVISVANSIWMNELELQKRTILKKIEQLKLGYIISHIRFRLSPDSPCPT